MATARYPDLVAVAYPHDVLEPWQPSPEAWRRAVEAGAFEGQRVELLDGRVVQMSPEGPEHEAAVGYLTQVVRRVPAAFVVRFAQAVHLAAGWEPEPDISVIAPGTPDPFRPATAAWVCEIAASSLARDRLVKAPAYAGAAIPEYWIVSLSERIVEVYSRPQDGNYGAVLRHRSGLVSSASVPGLDVDLDALWAAVFGP